MSCDDGVQTGFELQEAWLDADGQFGCAMHWFGMWGGADIGLLDHFSKMLRGS